MGRDGTGLGWKGEDGPEWGRDGTGWNETWWDGTRRDERVGTEWDGTERDGME